MSGSLAFECPVRRRRAGKKECRVLLGSIWVGWGTLAIFLAHLSAARAEAGGTSCHTCKAWLWLELPQLGHSQKAGRLLIA